MGPLDLAALDAVPLEEVPEAIGALEAAKARLWARLVVGQEHPASRAPSVALDIDEVVRRTGMSRPWLYREARAGRLPFARKLGRRFTFDEAGLTRWLEKRRAR
jgi:excisionase family DNA binding protein